MTSRWGTWILEEVDPVELDDTFVFNIGPNNASMPFHSKASAYSYLDHGAAVQDSQLLVGGDFSISGTLIDEQQHERFDEWASKPRPVIFKDHLGRQFLVIIESYEPSRVRSAGAPWKHTWSLQMFAIERLN